MRRVLEEPQDRDAIHSKSWIHATFSGNKKPDMVRGGQIASRDAVRSARLQLIARWPNA
jgi:hypothetical protein